LTAPPGLSKPNAGLTVNIKPASSSAGGAPVTIAVPRLDTSAVFGAGREVILLHRGQEYRLRITRTGKLILTK